MSTISNNGDEISETPTSTPVGGAGNGLTEPAVKIMASEKDVPEIAPKKSKVDLQSLPTRQYLDQTVVPILLDGLAKLVKERPTDPISFLANYMMKNKSQFESSSSSSSSTSSPSTKRQKLSS